MVEQRQQEPERREQILKAAFEEFAAKGFKGATIKSIAEAAGLQSPALIYWYFPDKEALFREVLRSQVPVLRAVADPAPIMDLPPEEVLPRLGRAYFAFEQFDVRMLQLMVGEAVRRPEVAEMFIRNGPGKVLEFLKLYLEHQIELGRLKPHDARSSARAFIGMLMPQLAGQLFFPALLEDGLRDEEHLKTAVNIFLEGLKPGG
ncbi:MAG: TetR/AcrR family transcriptional regulator [Actinomycetota bacterium]|nr:TetR/AcrR family transcriptional regulator [Rubrobacteraceae bacterium]MDQ3737016.1 TetR/AcrR family transcriptional regulator [Actinomycetota bacterium]MDQ3861824.1 TetR/AcrR family transcriptional regulator [Actinomycetota bacterium]MDQ5814036.1 TetR/AcrR family transcriptional regulator [Actinomycetota bacterium]